jgi:hypothetical protein
MLLSFHQQLQHQWVSSGGCILTSFSVDFVPCRYQNRSWISSPANTSKKNGILLTHAWDKQPVTPSTRCSPMFITTLWSALLPARVGGDEPVILALLARDMFWTLCFYSVPFPTNPHQRRHSNIQQTEFSNQNLTVQVLHIQYYEIRRVLLHTRSC